METVLVIGAYGLVGASLCPRLEAAGHTVLRHGRRDGAQLQFEPTSYDSIVAAFARWRPTVIINLVAATNVDACEADPQLAYRANVHTVEVLAKAIIGFQNEMPRLIHISSDQVYDGLGPHREADAQPCNVYALSKYAGELAAEKVGATILRTNIFGRSHAPNRISLSDWIVNSLRANTPIVVFDDVLFGPLHLETLADVICHAVGDSVAGIFNAGTSDGLSKAAFAFALAESLGLDCRLMTIGKATSAALRARRPKDMRMMCTAFERAFGIASPTIATQIRRAVREYQVDIIQG